jgi:predicted aspartyl protease
MSWRHRALTCGAFCAAMQFGATAASASPSTTSTTSSSSCDQPVTAGASPFAVPMKRLNSDGPQFAVQLCIEDRGPYRFIVDTGAEGTAIVPGLAKELGLPRVGRNQRTSGVGCNATASQRRVSNWSIGGVALSSVVAISQPIDGLGGHDEPMGLLGADVLSRFGAVRFDFTTSQLIFPGPEGPPPTKTTQFQGPRKSPAPPDLITGSPRVVPLAVQIGPGFASAVAPVTFGKHTGSFLIDTGSSASVVTPEFATSARLSPDGNEESGSSVCGHFTSVFVRTGRWSVGEVPLPRGMLASQDLPSGLDGILGADQISRFDSVVLSFSGGALLVGSTR